MPENFALYSGALPGLPLDQMEFLSPGVRASVSATTRGRTFTYLWPDLTVVCSEMPQDRLAEHLRGFVGYVHHIAGPCDPRAQRISAALEKTLLVVGFEVQPQRDAEGRAEEMLGKLAFGLAPIIFYADALYDQNSRLLLAPDRTFDPSASIPPWGCA